MTVLNRLQASRTVRKDSKWIGNREFRVATISAWQTPACQQAREHLRCDRSPRLDFASRARVLQPSLNCVHRSGRAVRFAAEPIAVNLSPHSNASMSRRGDPYGLRSAARLIGQPVWVIDAH